MTSRGQRVPGRRVLVRFEGDTYSHERVLLWPTHFDQRYESWVIFSAIVSLDIRSPTRKSRGLVESQASL